MQSTLHVDNHLIQSQMALQTLEKSIGGARRAAWRRLGANSRQHIPVCSYHLLEPVGSVTTAKASAACEVGQQRWNQARRSFISNLTRHEMELTMLRFLYDHGGMMWNTAERQTKLELQFSTKIMFVDRTQREIDIVLVLNSTGVAPTHLDAWIMLATSAGHPLLEVLYRFCSDQGNEDLDQQTSSSQLLLAPALSWLRLGLGSESEELPPGLLVCTEAGMCRSGKANSYT
jgi:hypothetical protein